VLSCEPA
jgi:DNA replication protein DnaC